MFYDSVAEPLTFSFLLIEDLSMMSLASAIEPLRSANRLLDREAFRWRLCSIDGKPVTASNGIVLDALPVDAALDGAHALFVCGGMRMAPKDEKRYFAVLRQAARRGVRVRLLLQGKLDYRIAGLAARALYAELQAYGVRIYEYTPAFLHAKVAVVDDDWATVGSSNIDPLSLLLNLEANVVVQDVAFARELRARFEVALAESHEVAGSHEWGGGWRTLALRGIVAWSANIYLRVAGITGRY